MYKVNIKKKAKKTLDKLTPLKTREKIRETIESLATNPFPREAKALAGFQDVYRIREGNWRIIYQVEEDELLIEVIKIGARGDVYKGGL